MPAKLHVLTGAPGSGKTAILSGLRGEVRCVDEPAREVLAQQRAVDGEGTPQRNPSLFVDLLLKRSIAAHQETQRLGGTVLFDRGVPDCIAYAKLLGTDPQPGIRAAAVFRCSTAVLVTSPWAQIYTTDDERTMTFEATVEFQRLIESAYEQAGYALIEVPRGPIEDRVAYIREFLTRASSAAACP